MTQTVFTLLICALVTAGIAKNDNSTVTLNVKTFRKCFTEPSKDVVPG
jgi:hypothetical protein